MFLSARLIWQFEPLLEIETKKKIPINARRRAALLLCLAMEKFIATSSVPDPQLLRPCSQRQGLEVA
jgi:hypothetical protein